VPTPDPDELIGRWSLTRRLHDRTTDQRGRVHGTLELSLGRDGVSWWEQGTLHWAGVTRPVSRRLHLEPGPDGWLVRFSDGRVFHPWRPGEPVEHPCRADLYRGIVVVSPDRQELRTLWDVTGPAKDQRLLTRCRRIDDPGRAD
jgi:hypothetical protein